MQNLQQSFLMWVLPAGPYSRVAVLQEARVCWVPKGTVSDGGCWDSLCLLHLQHRVFAFKNPKQRTHSQPNNHTMSRCSIELRISHTLHPPKNVSRKREKTVRSASYLISFVSSTVAKDLGGVLLCCKMYIMELHTVQMGCGWRHTNSLFHHGNLNYSICYDSMNLDWCVYGNIAHPLDWIQNSIFQNIWQMQ